MPAILKTLFKIGVSVYEFIDELRVEKRVNAEIAAKGHREQAKRYQEASNSAGPKKVLH